MSTSNPLCADCGLAEGLHHSWHEHKFRHGVDTDWELAYRKVVAEQDSLKEYVGELGRDYGQACTLLNSLKEYVGELGRDYGQACALLNRWVTPEKDDPEAQVFLETELFLEPRRPFDRDGVIPQDGDG